MKQENCNEKRIVVNSWESKIYLYDNNHMTKVFDEVYFGKNGVTEEKREGDFCTPKGEFSLGFAFGTQDRDSTYPYYKIDENVYWVSDSDSLFYNEWVCVSEDEKKYPYSYMKTCKEVLWKEAEHLSDYIVPYELAFVIEYNMYPLEKGKGSAIFFHVKDKDYTAGCISTSKESLEYILEWLGHSKATIEIK